MTIWILSLICFGTSILWFLFSKSRAYTTALYILGFSLIFIGYIVFAISDFFTGEGINSGVIYHVLHGQLFETNLIETYRPYVMATIGVLLLGILGLITMLWIKTKAPSKTHASIYTLGALLLAMMTHPLSITLYKNTHTSFVEAKAIEIIIKAEQQETPDVDPKAFATYYETAPIEAVTTTPNNLVLIYLEGLEYTFSEGEVFKALTPNLQQIEQYAVTFTNVSQISEASYTIGGFVASQCGIPLIAVTHGNTGEGYVDSYLSGATCLGDILTQYGYTTSYFGGASTVFAGKGTFLRSHGYDTVQGLHELTEIYQLNDSTTQGWGVYDDVLFEIVTNEYDKVSMQDDPFFLTMLTLDTHPPDGYISKTCIDASIAVHDMTMKNAIACTDYLVGKIVTHIMGSKAFENTTIVIVSDHLAMNSPISPLLKPYKRTNRFHIITKDTKQSYFNTTGTTLDIGTTVLPYIGFQGTIGLGQNLNDASTQNKSNIVRTIYPSWKQDILSLWEFPTLSQGIFFDPSKQQVVLDDAVYTFPAIITIDQTLSTTIGFKKYLELDLFFSLLPKIPKEHLTFIVDRCRMFVQEAYTDLTPTLPDNFCIGLFRDNTLLTIQEFMQPVYISDTELTHWQRTATQ